MGMIQSQRSVKEISKLRRRYPRLYKYADPDDYTNAFIRHYSFDDEDDYDTFYDYVYNAVYPYYFGFPDETDEEFTRRLRHQISLRYSKLGITLSHFNSADEFVRAAFDQFAGDDGSYSAAYANLYDGVAWYFEKKIVPVDRE